MCYHVALTHADTSTGIRKKNGIRRLALVHTVLIDIVSEVVLAKADTHDTVGTDVAYVIAHAAIVAMLQNTMTNPFFQFSCFEQFMLLCCHAVNSS